MNTPADHSPHETLSWPVITDRLTIRPAGSDDTESTWRYRRLDSVNRWITAAPPTLEAYRQRFEDLGLRRVIAQCFAENVSSRRLMQRVGMRLESYLVRDSLHRSGIWMDTEGYALLAEEWSSARSI